MPMDASQLNPFIRYMDLRCGSISYSEPIKAYDYRLFARANAPPRQKPNALSCARVPA